MKCNHENLDFRTVVWVGSGRTFMVCNDCDVICGSEKGYHNKPSQEWLDLKREQMEADV